METGWTQLIAQHDALKSTSIEVLYKRVCILRKVSRLQSFEDDMDAIQMDPIDFLDEKVGDTGFSFSALDRLLNRFPRIEDWSNERFLGALIEKAAAEERSERLQAREASRPKVNVSEHNRSFPGDKGDRISDTEQSDIAVAETENIHVVGKQTQYGRWEITPEVCLAYIHKFYVDNRLQAADVHLRPLIERAWRELGEVLKKHGKAKK